MKIEYSEQAFRQLSKLDKPVQKQIKNYMDEVAALEDPRSRGRALKGTLSELWRYRSGDYRIICNIQDDKILITILRLGHRKEVYKTKKKTE